MSIANIALTPLPPAAIGLPKIPEGATATHSARAHERLPRLAAAVTNCALQDLAAALSDLLCPFVEFDYFDIVAFEENRAEVLWHSVSGTLLHPGDEPTQG